MTPPDRGAALMAIWICTLLLSLGMGSAGVVAVVMAAAGPVARMWRAHRVRRFRRRLRAVAAARGVRWTEPAIEDDRRLVWKLRGVAADRQFEWELKLEPRKMSDAEIVEWLRPVAAQGVV